MVLIKRGRPKDINLAKNRVHSVVLSVKAETLLRSEVRKRGSKKWFNAYLSRRIVDDFGKGSDALEVLELLDLQERRNKLNNEIQAKASKLSKKRLELSKKRLAYQCTAKVTAYINLTKEEALKQLDSTI